MPAVGDSLLRVAELRREAPPPANSRNTASRAMLQRSCRQWRMRMPRMKGADLIRNKIPYVFGICGHGNVGLLDALYGARDRIKLVSPRHEQVAAHMADAYFRVRHEPVTTLTSCGPGSCNIVMALQVALSHSSALLAITANVPTQQFNRSPFQE